MNHHPPRGSLAASESAAREEQLEAGRRMAQSDDSLDAAPIAPRSTLSLPDAARRTQRATVMMAPPPARTEPVRKSGMPRTGQAGVPKGHEAFLKALITSGAEIRVEKCDGKTYTGRIKHADKFTITMNADGSDRVIFKHDISEFSAATGRKVEGKNNG